MSSVVYLDNHATTPIDPRVLEAMLPHLRGVSGNASSVNHAYGLSARAAVLRARSQVAALLGARPEEIVFTSGATEATNLGLLGAARAARSRGNRILSAATEHASVLEVFATLAREGFEVVILPVEPDGRLSLEVVERAVVPGTILASFMLANNEIGVVHDVVELGRLLARHGVMLHVDASQGAGKVAFDVNQAPIALASLSSHKLYGPQGVGALFVRSQPAVELTRVLHGGGQENGLRPGTLNVPGIVGFGAACELAGRERDEEARRVGRLRERLRARLLSELDGVHLNGALEPRLAGNLNVYIADVDGRALLGAIQEIAVSAGSACSSQKAQPSHVLRALGLAPTRASSSIRIGIGRFNTEADIELAADVIVRETKRLRALPDF